jgi:Na+-transporting methylmalonyl-CoA/oxaloacetate decarboxylase gamma subunit
LARKSPRQHRTSQIIFVVLSILVVVSMAIGYVITMIPLPSPPTPTPTPLPTLTPEASWAPFLAFLI